MTPPRRPPEEPPRTPPTTAETAAAAAATGTAPPAASAATGSAAAAALAASTPVLSAKAIARILEAYDRGMRVAGTTAAEDLLLLLTREYPTRPLEELRLAADAEVQREREFQRKQRLRLETALKAAQLLPPDQRRAAMRAALDREVQYRRQREEAMAVRAINREEQNLLHELSPRGAYWKLSPDVSSHTLDCLAMGERFWPWEVLDIVFPPLHHGCPCELYGEDEAIGLGLMGAADVPDPDDAMARARRLAREIPELRERWDDDHIQEALLELAEARYIPQHWAAGSSKGGEFKPRRGGSPGSLIRHLLDDVLPGGLPEPPSRSRFQRDVRIRGEVHHIPERRWERRFPDGTHFTSPAGGTNVYRDGALVAEPGVPELHPEVGAHSGGRASRPDATPKEKVEAGRERHRSEVRAARKGGAPLREGDPEASIAALEGEGWEPVATDRGATTYRNRETGASMTVATKQGKVAWVAHDQGEPGVRAVRAKETPPTWDAFRADTMAMADELAAKHGAAMALGDFEESAKGWLEDIVGHYSPLGIATVGPEAPEITARVAEHRRRGVPLDTQTADDAWYVAQTSAHEASHGVNPPDWNSYVTVEGKNLEEALTEEASHSLAADRLRDRGDLDILRWNRDNPTHPDAMGPYPTQRLMLAQLANAAGIAPEDRREWVEALKFEVHPADRRERIAGMVAAEQGWDSTRADAFVGNVLNSGKPNEEVGRPTSFATSPDLSGLGSREDGAVMHGGKRLGPGALVRAGKVQGRVQYLIPPPEGEEGGPTYLDLDTPDGPATAVLGEGVTVLEGSDDVGGDNFTEGEAIRYQRPDGAWTAATIDQQVRGGENWELRATTEDGRTVLLAPDRVGGIERRAGVPEGEGPGGAPPEAHTLEGMTRDQLREMARGQGIDAQGSKGELTARLRAAGVGDDSGPDAPGPLSVAGAGSPGRAGVAPPTPDRVDFRDEAQGRAFIDAWTHEAAGGTVTAEIQGYDVIPGDQRADLSPLPVVEVYVELRGPNGEHVGAAVRHLELDADGSVAEVQNEAMDVAPEWQRQGVATSLNRYMEEEWRRQGAERVTLKAVEGGTSAWALTGFQMAVPSGSTGQGELLRMIDEAEGGRFGDQFDQSWRLDAVDAQMLRDLVTDGGLEQPIQLLAATAAEPDTRDVAEKALRDSSGYTAVKYLDPPAPFGAPSPGRTVDGLQPEYQPDAEAPAAGEFVRAAEGGEAIAWRQRHDELLKAALQTWKGQPNEMRIHMAADADFQPVPDAGSGKQMREQARALRWELDHNSRPTPVLYRGAGQLPEGPTSWSEERWVADRFAGGAYTDQGEEVVPAPAGPGGAVYQLPAGEARGIKVGDYSDLPIDKWEAEWIIDAQGLGAASPGRKRDVYAEVRALPPERVEPVARALGAGGIDGPLGSGWADDPENLSAADLEELLVYAVDQHEGDDPDTALLGPRRDRDEAAIAAALDGRPMPWEGADSPGRGTLSPENPLRVYRGGSGADPTGRDVLYTTTSHEEAAGYDRGGLVQLDAIPQNPLIVTHKSGNARGWRDQVEEAGGVESWPEVFADHDAIVYHWPAVEGKPNRWEFGARTWVIAPGSSFSFEGAASPGRPDDWSSFDLPGYDSLARPAGTRLWHITDDPNLAANWQERVIDPAHLDPGETKYIYLTDPGSVENWGETHTGGRPYAVEVELLKPAEGREVREGWREWRVDPYRTRAIREVPVEQIGEGAASPGRPSAIDAPDAPWRSTQKEYAPYPENLTDEYPDHPLDSPLYRAYRERRDTWERSMADALTWGRLTREEAEAKGYYDAHRDYHPLPERLYHVTTGPEQSIRDRGLLTREELDQGPGRGLGAGPDNQISLTGSRAIADAIATSMVEAGAASRGEIPLEELARQAREGEGADRPWLDDLKGVLSAQELDRILNDAPEYAVTSELRERPPGASAFGMSAEEIAASSRGPSDSGGWEADPASLIADTSPPKYTRARRQREPTLEDRARFYRYWSSARGIAGGPLDPLFMGVPADALEAMNPDSVRVVEASGVPEAHGEYLPALLEWRVGTGAAIRVDDVRPPAELGTEERVAANRETYAAMNAAREGRAIPGGPSDPSPRDGAMSPGRPRAAATSLALSNDGGAVWPNHALSRAGAASPGRRPDNDLTRDLVELPADEWLERSSYQALPGAEYYVAGGCADLALALKARHPEMKLAAQWYNDGGRRALAHVIAYDPESGIAWDAYGSHTTADEALDAYLDNYATERNLDADPFEIAEQMQLRWNPESPWEDMSISAADSDVVERYFAREPSEFELERRQEFPLDSTEEDAMGLRREGAASPGRPEPGTRDWTPPAGYEDGIEHTFADGTTVRAAYATGTSDMQVFEASGPSLDRINHVEEEAHRKPVTHWLAQLGLDELEGLYPETDWSEDFWRGVERLGAQRGERGASGLAEGTRYYHGTNPENVAAILEDGLEARNETRGFTNRGTGAAVFLHPYRDYAIDYAAFAGETADYPGLVSVDLAAMARDGVRPQAGPEGPVREVTLREAVASSLGLEDYYDDSIDSDGIDRDTLVVYGDIPAEYIRDENEGASSPGRPEPIDPADVRVDAPLEDYAPGYRAALAGPRGDWLTPLTDEELGQRRLLVGPSGRSGGYLHPDEHGIEAGGLYRLGDAPRGEGAAVLARQLQEGATHLYAYRGELTDYYESLGWTIAQADPWDPELAPDGWNEAERGTPDYVRMVPPGS